MMLRDGIIKRCRCVKKIMEGTKNLVSFGTGKFVAESGAEFHQTRGDIDTILSGKSSDLDNGEKYGQHHYDIEIGKCTIEGCNAMDPNHSTEQPGDNQENQGLEGVNPK